MTRAPAQNAPALKGSWESMLAEARTLGQQGNDEAIEKFRFLLDRLLKMPEEQRMAQDGRLYKIFEQALFGLQSYYAKRDRLEEAITAYDENVRRALDEDALAVWRENQARILSWQGAYERAAEILWEEVEDAPFDESLRWVYLAVAVEGGLAEHAQQAIASLQAHLDEGLDGLEDSHRGLLHYMRAYCLLDAQAWEEAYDEFAQAAKAAESYRKNWHLLYRPLVVNRQFKLAQRALNREESPAAQGFWRGLAGGYNGDPDGAKAEWRQVTQIPLEEVTVRTVADWILAHYYLGDEGRTGLQVAMTLLRQEKMRRDPLLLALAGLGWGLHGHEDHMHRNLRFAVEQMRASLLDAKLPVFNWYFFRDLLQPEEFAELEQHFHQPRTPQPEST